MGGQVEILCGIAGSGKTARLLEAFRAELRRLRDSTSPGEAVWITPTNRSRRALLRNLLDKSLPACFAPNIVTFDSFAERLLRSAGVDILPLSPISKRIIARCLVDEVREEGRLKYFEPIAGTSGFLDLLLDFIADLKREETWPEDFDAACRKRGSLRKDVELSQLYGRYQRRLQDLALYDSEGRFWSARAALAEGQRGSFGRLSLVVIDGFADFTQPQYEIIEHLSKYADRVVVSLPLEEPLVRSDLFAKSTVAIQELARRAAGVSRLVSAPRRHIESDSNDVQSTFRHLARHLFDNPRGLPQATQAAGLEIIEAAGLAGEARAIAERIKELLLSGAAAESIVVATRSLDDDGDLLSASLTAAGIPNWCEGKTPLSRLPIAKALFAALQVELDDWRFDRLCALLRSNYFRPRFASASSSPAIDRTIRALRARKLGSGRRRILHQFASLADDVEKGTPDDQIAVAVLQDLSASTERLRHSVTFASWVDRLTALCNDLGIAPTDRSARSSTDKAEAAIEERDRQHWELLRSVLYDAARTWSHCAKETKTPNADEMSFADLVGWLRDILDSQTFSPPDAGPGQVVILNASEVRNLDIDYLFCAGLSEASFPRARRDDCFYTESERLGLLRPESAGMDRSSPQQDEMLLFYSIVTRARRRLTLSFPSMSASGQPLFQSPFVAALRDLFAPGSIRVKPAADLDPVPTLELVMTSADLRLVATEAARTKSPGLFRAMTDRPDLAPAARGVLASAEMAAARFEQKGFTAFEGILAAGQTSEGTVARRLSEKFKPDYQFSTTQLESYARCPFRFFLMNVLNLSPVEFSEGEIDARDRGKWLHSVLRSLHDANAQDAQKPAADSRRIARDLRALIDDELAIPADASDFQSALLTAERRFAERFTDLYAAQWTAYQAGLAEAWDEPARPHRVEIPFGDFPARPGVPLGKALPFARFGPKGKEVRIRGFIDRVDVGRCSDRTAFTVIDYKTKEGKSFKFEDIRAGVALQLAIYASAVRQSGLLGSDAVLHQMAYWGLTQAGCISGVKGLGTKKKPMAPLHAEALDELQHLLDEILPEIVTRMRAGEFPVRNADLECTGSCEFSSVCRVNQIRSLGDEWEKLWQLTKP